MDNYTRVILHRLSPDWGNRSGETSGNDTGADPLAGAGAGALDEGEGHSQRVAKVNPTAMKAMPTARFHWPRSFMTGSPDRSLEKT